MCIKEFNCKENTLVIHFLFYIESIKLKFNFVYSLTNVLSALHIIVDSGDKHKVKNSMHICDIHAFKNNIC